MGRCECRLPSAVSVVMTPTGTPKTTRPRKTTSIISAKNAGIGSVKAASRRLRKAVSGAVSPNMDNRKLRFELALGFSVAQIAARHHVSPRVVRAAFPGKLAVDPFQEVLVCRACNEPIDETTPFTVLEGAYWHLRCIPGF